MTAPRYDLLLVGGGLANTLLALTIAERRSDWRIRVIEAGNTLGGDHTWSFHATDVSDEDLGRLKRLAAGRWSGHSVRFPAYSRALGGDYLSLRSPALHAHAMKILGDRVTFGRPVERVTPYAVCLAGGERLTARAVIDGRGIPELVGDRVAYQKFVGLDLKLARPHGLHGPVIMDATVPQEDGFRFFYLLPWTEDRILVEDTRYSDTPGLAVPAYREEVLTYAARRGWEVAQVERLEVGCLPIPLAESFLATGTPRETLTASGVPRVGTRAGLFHPTTGYSLPDALRVAQLVADSPTPDAAALVPRLVDYARATENARWFYRLLNRFLFEGAQPEARYRVLEKFYRLPEPLIARFYAGRTTFWDGCRILSGRPPIPISRALRCLSEPWPIGRQSARAALFGTWTPSEAVK